MAMLLSELEEYVGHSIQVRIAGGIAGFMGVGGSDIGILKEVTEGYLLLERPDGEIAFIPAANVRGFLPVDEPPTPSTTLLRSSNAPDDPLLRPAGVAPDSSREKLLKPSGPA